MVDHYNFVIVGSGPAGSAAAFYLKDNMHDAILSKRFRVGIFDRTRYPSGGLINDGKMNLTPFIGFDDYKDGRVTLEQAWEHIKYFEQIICRHGDDPPITGTDQAIVSKWEKRLGRHGLQLITETRQRHIGTDRSKKLIDGMRTELEQNGIEFRLGEDVREIIKTSDEKFELLVAGNGDSYTVTCDYLLVAPGRLGTQWFRHQMDKLNAQYSLLPIEVGVRIEMLYEDYPIAHDIRDPKIKLVAPNNGDQVKTFCTNPRGKIRFDMPEQAIHYKSHELVMINGDGLRNPERQTGNTNFAILNKIALVEPEQDTEQYALDLAIKTFRAGDWKPIVQRLGKFLHYRRSKPEDFGNGERVQPTVALGALTPGDINIVYPARTVHNIRIILEMLAQEMPQVLNPENLIYAPEIKFQNVGVEVTSDLETTIERLFVAGNGAGLSSGIVGAASNGILVAKGLLKRVA